jgi:streptomycin 6-kinase
MFDYGDSPNMKKLTQQILSAYKEAGKKWLDELPGLVQSLAERWQLSDLLPYENLSWNFVTRGFQSGRQVVLKISYDLLSLRTEVAALKEFPKEPCVEVIQFDESCKAVLLEAADPGIDLMSFEGGNWHRVVGICCDIAQKIKKGQKPPEFSFKSIREQFNGLEKEWDIPEKILLRARNFKKELIASDSDIYVIHGDLHRGNILSHGDGWRAIDPKGFTGTLYNEVWPFVHNPDVEVPWIANRLSLDEDRLMKWCFMHSVLATTWCIEDNVDPKNIFGLAEKIFKLI